MFRDSRYGLDFDNETLKSLLEMNEGPSLDFKQEQYRFNNASEREKSELLKDILAFANSQRYRTAYILIGVKDVKGGSSEAVGVEEHLDDANLHQFVNSKTNKPVEFSYFQFQLEDKQIGVLRIPIQLRPIYTINKYGKIPAKTVYMRDGSSTRPASPDDIADMGRSSPPRLVEWSIDRLRNIARNAIVNTVEQWQRHPRRSSEYGPHPKNLKYDEARDWVLRMVRERYATLDGYPDGMDSYGSLYWIFKNFEELATYCTQTIRTIGSALIESGALLRAIAEMEECINFETNVWDEFRIRTGDPRTPLPGEAHYNLLSVAARTVRFIEVLDDEEHYWDPDHVALSPYNRPLFQRSEKWGDWR